MKKTLVRVYGEYKYYPSYRGIILFQALFHDPNFSQWKKPWLGQGYIGDEILLSYIGIIINHYKDPY